MPYDRFGRWYPHFGEMGEFEPYYGQPTFLLPSSSDLVGPIYTRFQIPHEIGPFREPTFAEEQRARGRFAGIGPVGYRRADARILAEVNEALARDPWLNASGIHVAVQNGEVTLTGTVEMPAEKRRAGQIAWDVPGVRDVHNRLRIAALVRATEQPAEQSADADSVKRGAES